MNDLVDGDRQQPVPFRQFESLPERPASGALPHHDRWVDVVDRAESPFLVLGLAVLVEQKPDRERRGVVQQLM